MTALIVQTIKYTTIFTNRKNYLKFLVNANAKLMFSPKPLEKMDMDNSSSSHEEGGKDNVMLYYNRLNNNVSNSVNLRSINTNYFVGNDYKKTLTNWSFQKR